MSTRSETEALKDPLTLVILDRVKDFYLVYPTSIKIGSVAQCRVYMTEVESAINRLNASEASAIQCLVDLLDKKRLLNRRISGRGFNKSLMDSMFRAEEVTHLMLDLLQSHMADGESVPDADRDVRFDWSGVLTVKENRGPIYLTQYGVRDFLVNLASGRATA